MVVGVLASGVYYTILISSKFNQCVHMWSYSQEDPDKEKLKFDWQRSDRAPPREE